MPQPPLILFVDDNLTIRKVVEGYLSQAGYRIVLAADATRGLDLARSTRPDLILLDHQLPGTTGDRLCRQLLEHEETAGIPVVICSTMRNKAFVQYADLPNVVDQIPKPFTPEALRGGVANALQTGALVVQAQRTGSAMPETIGQEASAALEGDTAVFPLRVIFGMLNGSKVHGRLTVDVGQDRLRFAVASGRVQAAYSSTVNPDRVAALLPPELADMALLLPVSLAEQQDAQTSGLLKFVERSLSDPRRLRAFLRTQSSILAYWALTAEPGPFSFQAGGTLSPMFLAFPLHLSLAALAVEGVRRCEPIGDPDAWAPLVFRRLSTWGSSSDPPGLSALALKVLASLDGLRDLASVGREAGLEVGDVATLARGLELAGLVERRADVVLILIVDDDLGSVRAIREAIQTRAPYYQSKVVDDRVGAQLLLRRARFDIVLIGLDRPDQEQFFSSVRAQAHPGTRFVGVVESKDEGELMRLDALGLDGVIERPVTEGAVLATIKHLIETKPLSKVS
jgi:CheY-like chemotaxis protein